MASVNHPTNMKEKEDDVNRKLQIYGIISAFQAGKVPSNDQIDVALNSFLASSILADPSNKLSSEGRSLINDTREVIKQAKFLLLSKNEGNLLQDFIWQTQQFHPTAVNTPGAPVDRETAQHDRDQALEGMRTLGTLIISNGQFRKLLHDATVLFREIASDAAANAAHRVRPSDEDLQQMDRPAADNTWHDAPDFSKGNAKQQFQRFYKGDPKEDLQAAANKGTATSHPEGKTDPRGVADIAARDRAEGNGNAGVDVAGGASAAANHLQQRVDEQMTDEAKEKKEKAANRAREYREKTKAYFTQKVPEERRDQIIWRLKKMVLECQQHPDYRQAIETLITLAEQYGGHAQGLAQGGTDTVKDARTGFAAAERDLKTLIERFANGTSSDDLWSSINTIYEESEKDPELKEWFKALNNYIRRLLQEQGYVIEDESTQDWHRIHDRGQYLLRDKYRSQTTRVLDEIKFLADQFDQDQQSKSFGLAVQKLFHDLGNDDNGKPTFKPHLIKDLTEVIIPAILEKTAYIPIPRIEYTDSQFDAVIENLVLESDNFMPNVLEIASENYIRWGRKNASSKQKHSIEVSVRGVQMDLREVSYHVRRKQGFPSLTDTGVADILMAGDGFCFKIKMSTADDKDGAKFFKVDKVDVDVKHLKIQLRESSHKFLFNLFKPLMLKVLRPALQKAAEKAIKDQVGQLDALCFQVKQEADRALDEVREDPSKAPNAYSRYSSALQKRVLQGKKKAENVVADKKVNVAMTKEDSIFPQLNLPGGISTKATEYRELARKGDKWESPVFSIGSAKKSTDIPAAPKITRKPHQTSSGAPGTDHASGSGTGNGQYVASHGSYGTGQGSYGAERLPGSGNGHSVGPQGSYGTGQGTAPGYNTSTTNPAGVGTY